MALKETICTLRELIDALASDLEKGGRGNKTAAQRFRTNSIKFTKISKIYRKESIQAERGGKKAKKPAKRGKGVKK